MELIQPTFLYALAALGIPVIVHLIFRWQTRRVELGTTRFLAELLQETARRRKVRRWLLLALRLACVTLLAFLFARPFVLARQSGNSRKLVILLFDRSASMSLTADGTRLIDAAISQAQQLFQDQRSEVDVRAALFDTAVTPVSFPLGEPASIPADWPLLRSLSGATSYGAAMSWARDTALKSTAASRDIHIFTDLQRAGLDWSDTAPFPDDVRVQIHEFGQLVGDNAAIVDVRPSRTLLSPGQGVQVAVTLFNFGQFSHEETPVLLTLQQGTRTLRMQQKASLRSGEATEVSLSVQGLDAGLWSGSITMDLDDDLAFDNVRYFALLAAPQQRVLVVDGNLPTAGVVPDTFFLEQALRLSSDDNAEHVSPFQPTVVRLEQHPLPSLENDQLVVLVNTSQLTAAEADRLAAFVRSGGGLLVFSGDNMLPEGCHTLAQAGLTPGEIHPPRVTHDLPFRWQEWNDRHLALAPFTDPQNGDLHRLTYFAYTPVTPRSSTRVLASFNTNDPALTEQTLGQGRILWFLSGCDRDWGDWLRSRLFLPLVHQLLGDLARLTGGGPIQSLLLGEPIPATRTADGVAIPSPDEPGIVPHHQRWYVYNIDPRESDVERCTPEEFANRFRCSWSGDDSPAEPAAVPIEHEGIETHRDEVWPWLACALIGLFGIEWILSNRTTP
ncbi:MAG: BatA domain-containing protein [Planctomycetaceae bacterium]